MFRLLFSDRNDGLSKIVPFVVVRKDAFHAKLAPFKGGRGGRGGERVGEGVKGREREGGGGGGLGGGGGKWW